MTDKTPTASNVIDAAERFSARRNAEPQTEAHRALKIAARVNRLVGL